MLEELIKEDFPFLEIEKIVDVEASEDGESLTARIIAKDKRVYSLFLDKETVRPVLQRFI